jgi:GH25 family lysozyme M1 (1,4-beta-N-acetylmuramidase)
MSALKGFGGLAAAAVAWSWAAAASADIVSAMVDISSYQDVDTVTKAAKASGFELVMHRATLGADGADQAFPAALRKIRSARLSVGAYHVLYAQGAPEDLAHGGLNQAHQFLSAVAGACKSGEPVLLALDWESPGGKPPASAQTAAEFVSEVHSQTGADLVIYSDARTLDAVRSGIGAILTQSPLWFAAYHRAFRFESDPYKLKYTASDSAIDISIQRPREDGLTFPIADDFAPWTSLTFWQFSEGGPTGAGPNWDPVRQIEPAISPWDTSFFFGRREDFRKFVAATSWKCDPRIAKHWANVIIPPTPPAPSAAPAPAPPPAPPVAPG